MQNESEIRFLNSTFTSPLSLPFADGGVHAGFPSPSQDYMDKSIDFNRDLVKHPEATFYASVVGDSMIEAGIKPGDLLVIDRALQPFDGCVAVCCLDGEFAIKQLDLKHKSEGRVVLKARNQNYEDIVITPERQFELWGVVAYVIHSCVG